MRTLSARVYWIIFRIYHCGLSPFLHLLGGSGFGCRFHPTCSAYAYEAVQIHGFFRGSWLALRRLSRCHPFSRAPLHDPVVTPVRIRNSLK